MRWGVWADFLRRGSAFFNRGERNQRELREDLADQEIIENGGDGMTDQPGMGMGDGKHEIMPGFRVPELFKWILIAVITSGIAGAVASWATVQVLQSRMTNMENRTQLMRQELQDLRRDLYRPRWENSREEIIPGTGFYYSFNDGVQLWQ